MIIKWKYITILFIVLLMIFCCKSRVMIQQQVVKDVYGNPICFILKNDEVIYYSVYGEKISANLGGIEFNGGRDSLSTYLLTKYINHPEYNYQEYNIYERFFVLFDKNMCIKEVRIMYREYANNERFYYDSIFIDALKDTNGMWHKTIENKGWYVYLHSQRIY